jgi:hypothetical protein
MSSFAPPDFPDERTHRHLVAEAANAALRGETHNTGVFTLPAGATEFTLHDPRIGVEKVLLLSPLDAGAATLAWWIEESATAKGVATIKFATAAAANCRFNYAIVGTKRLGA